MVCVGGRGANAADLCLRGTGAVKHLSDHGIAGGGRGGSPNMIEVV